MFHKIIKRGHRKGPKSDESGGTPLPPGNHVAKPQPSLPPPPDDVAPIVAAPPPATIESLPSLKDVSSSERQTLFLKKLQICCYMFDFSDTLKLVRQKEIKRQTLLELIEFIQSGSEKIHDRLQADMIKMVGFNVFRSLPPTAEEASGTVEIEPEEDEPYMEPSWTHLQLVYELLLRYVVSKATDTRVAKRYVDHVFLVKLIEMFRSEDPREREYLKTTVHRIYGKFMVHRPFLRTAINNILYRFIHEGERHAGIAELLEILGSVINGFAMPMKEEHRLFLRRVLIPLHKAKTLGVYQAQLSYCVTQFVEKDYRLAPIVIRGLLKFWPVLNSQKEVLFLGELEEVLEVTNPSEFGKCMDPLFRQVARCLRSPHFQVAEKALFLWNNEHIVSLIAANKRVILSILFDALERNIQSHWNPAIHSLTVNVRKMFQELDYELYEDCRIEYQDKVATSQVVEEQRNLAWKRVFEVAQQNMIPT